MPAALPQRRRVALTCALLHSSALRPPPPWPRPRSVPKGRRLSLRQDEAAELFERSETLREQFLLEHPSIIRTALKAAASKQQPHTLGRQVSPTSL